MKKYFYIGIGGFVGACLRYFVKNVDVLKQTGGFPVNTLLINISGSFVLAFFLTTAYEIIEINEEARLGFAAGFLGAFTTFSTMCKEASSMIDKGQYLSSFLYLSGSVILGMLLAYAGVISSRVLIPGIHKHRRQNGGN